MKMPRFVLSLFAMSLATAALAQQPVANAVQPSSAQRSFNELKMLAGTWLGTVTMGPAEKDRVDMEVSMRVMSSGNSLLHEMKEAGKPDDPKHDHPVTMFYVDGDRLLLTHYCDAGNRPRMVARSSADGKTIEFDFLDISGGTQHGRMDHAVFTAVDANHHTEDWTYVLPGDKIMHAHADLVRTK